MAERVRFSPSPSGVLHIGGARTALFNWLIARASGGQFIVRIEDTDATRADAAHAEEILDDLDWLGLVPDESPRVGGAHAPYLQSERAASHREALETLQHEGAVYPCFCTEPELVAQRARDAESSRAPRYSGTCRSLSSTDRDGRVAAGEPHVWRFAVPAGRRITVHDLIHGDVGFNSDDMGDFVLMRSDGTPTYDLACVADDIDMCITMVLRGDDHLSNTPRQILIHEALAGSVPDFAHVPLVHDSKGRPLSKSSGAAGIGQLREQGYLPAAVLNHLALIGWTAPDGSEILTPDELIQAFDISRVSKSAGSHDVDRLNWIGSQHMISSNTESLAVVVAPFLANLPGWLDRGAVAEALKSEVSTGQEMAAAAGSLAEPARLDAEAHAALSMPDAGSGLRAAETALLNPGDASMGAALRRELKAAGVPARVGMPAIRAALTGRAHGLPLDTVMDLLGGARTLERIRVAQGFDTPSGVKG
jgi:nondiscriminating glutamyl-tRNA synthetase